MEYLQLLYLAIFAIVLFGSLTFLRKWADSFIMIAFAIGALCNCGFFNSSTHPITVGNAVFAIDSILYTLFLYTVGVKFIHYSKKDSRLFIASSLIAVVITALITFFANTITFGYDVSYLKSMLGFFASVVASLVATVALRKTCKLFFRFKWNRFIALPFSIVVACIFDTLIYYSLTYLIYGSTVFNNFGGVLLGSYIGKLFCIGLGVLGYFINGTIWPVNDLKFKEDLSKNGLGE